MITFGEESQLRPMQPDGQPDVPDYDLQLEELRHLTEAALSSAFVSEFEGKLHKFMDSSFSLFAKDLILQECSFLSRDQATRLAEASFSSLSADLKTEDADWVALSNLGNRTQRRHAIDLARRYAANDANCRQIIRLYTDFGINDGLTWRADEESDNATLMDYWEDPRNRKRLSTEGQRASSDALLIDGEFYFAHVRQVDGSIKTRKLDAKKVVDWIVDPDDADDVRGYLYETTIDSSNRKYLYIDWLNEEWETSGVLRSSGERPQDDYIFVPEIFIQPVILDPDESGRGTSKLYATLVWAKFQRHFMRIRAAIQQAVAMFIREVKMKGSQTQVNSLMARYNISKDSIHSQDIPGASTWFGNEGVEMKNLKQDTGADGARVDGGMLLQMIGSSAGIHPTRFGHGDRVEDFLTPTEKRAFESYQQLWRDAYRYLFEWVLASEGTSFFDPIRIITEGSRKVEVDFSTIETKDVPKLIHAINEVMSLNQGLRYSEDYHKFLLTELGHQDVAEIWERISPLIEEQKKIDEENRLAVLRNRPSQRPDNPRATGDGQAENLGQPSITS